MDFVIKFSPEISLKSKPVRQRFLKILESNIKNVLFLKKLNAKVKANWDRIFCSFDFLDTKHSNDKKSKKALEVLGNIPGIISFAQVNKYQISDLNSVLKIIETIDFNLGDQSFCIRAKRTGKHDFSSLDLEKKIGEILCQNNPKAKVKLKAPEKTIKIEIKNEFLYVIVKQNKGLGGMPIATQEDVLCLISGGFDSAVVAQMLIKRGMRVHFCFFNLGGDEHSKSVKKLSYLLWQKYGISHRIKFIEIDFASVVYNILENCTNGNKGVVLKRKMFHSADIIAKRLRVNAIATGEAIGQVSSQTITNLDIINKASKTLIIRPLIATDKSDIIETANKIGVKHIVEKIPEYCSVISQNPNVRAVLDNIIADEKKLANNLIDNAIKNADVFDIKNLMDEILMNVTTKNIKTISQLSNEDILLDVRNFDDQEKNPLCLDCKTNLHIPYFKLEKELNNLDKSKTYCLYCTKGVMSQIWANKMQDAGFENIFLLQKN